MNYRFLLVFLLFWIASESCFAREIDLPEGYELSSFFNESLLSNSEKSEEDLIPKIPSLEVLPSLIAAGCVHTQTGDFLQQETDLIVPGFKPLFVKRSWDSSKRKWHFGYASKMRLQASRHHLNAIYQENGSGLLFKGPLYLVAEDSLKVSSKMFKSGLTNCSADEISGQTNWKNAALYYVMKGEFPFVLFAKGTHVNTIFGHKSPYRSFLRNGTYLPIEEIDPNGKKISFHHDKKKKLQRITATTSNREVTGSLNISRLNNVHIWSSETGRVVYTHEGKKLKEIHSSQGKPITYVYDNKRRIIKKQLPEGRYLSVKYYKSGKGKVKCLKAPVGIGGKRVTTHTFDYMGGKKDRYTLVKDALGKETTYAYDKGRLQEISKYDGKTLLCRETIEWDKEGHLLSQTFQDESQIIHVKKLLYDKKGNIIQETLQGNLTGHRSNEEHHKFFSATQDDWHLPLEEKEGELWKRFAYVPKTNLLKSRFTGTHETILKREFFEYDDNGFCINEIFDDGSNEEVQDLTAVTERHIKKITPTKTFPFGLPETIETFCLDTQTETLVPIRTISYRYSLLGKVLEERHYDHNGTFAYSLEWEYDEQGNLLSQKDALGQVVYFTYDVNHNKLSEQHLYVTKLFLYDQVNRLIQEKEVWPDGTILTTSHRYNVLSQKEATIDNFGNETLYQYDPLGHLIEVSHPPLPLQTTRPIERKQYDVAGNVIAAWDSLGYCTKTAFTARGQPYLIEYPDGSKEKKVYTLEGRLEKEIGKNGLETHYFRDPLGRIIKKELRSPSGELLKSTTSTYNTFHLLSETDEEGFTTFYAYDLAGRKIREEKEGKVTTFEYDTLGRIFKTKRWVNHTNAEVKVILYDALDRIIEERTEEISEEVFRRIQYAYDTAGNRSKIISFTQNGEAISTTTYTPRGDPIYQTDPLGNITQTHYDFHASYEGSPTLKITQVDPLGNQEVFLKDSFGNTLVHTRLDTQGQKVQEEIHRYDLCRRLIETQSAGYKVEWQRDCMGREVYCREPEQKVTRHLYNSFGQKIQTVKPDGIILYYAFDPLGRLINEKSSNGKIDYSYEYDKKDHLISARNNISQTKTIRIYDALDRLIQEALETGYTITYTYDSLDRLTQVILPDQSEIHFNYSGCRLYTVDRIKNGKTVYSHRYTQYDESGNCVTEELACGGELHREYDLLQRVVSLQAPSWNENVIYDAVGNITAKVMSDPKGTFHQNFTYDPLYQLIHEEHEKTPHQYRYDSLYNRIEKDGRSYFLNPLNQVTSAEDVSYLYDPNGNLIEKSSHHEKTTYVYDPLNRLTQVITPKNTTTYTYDAFHRRLKKIQETYVEDYFYLNDLEIGAYVNGVLKQLRVLGQGIGDVGASVALEIRRHTLCSDS